MQFKGIILLLSLLLVTTSAEFVKVAQSFQGNDFKDQDGWTVGGAKAAFADCKGTKLFGGYGKFGQKAVATKLFELPPHSQVQIELQFWKIGSWDNEEAYIFVDDQLVWSRKFGVTEGDDKCGNAKWKNDLPVKLDLKLKHTGPTAAVVITTNLNEDADNEAWAIRDFVLSVEACPEGCDACSSGDDVEKCNYWRSFESSWTDLDHNQLGADGWDVKGGAVGATNCGGVALFGGYDKFGAKATVSKTIQMQPHYKLKLKVLWGKIDSWDNEQAIIKLDGKNVWTRKFGVTEGYHGKICGGSTYAWKSFLARVEIDVDHTGNSAQLEFTSTLNEAPNNEAFGLRDLYVYYAACSANCGECTGPKEGDCKKCLNNWSLVDGKCQPLSNFILLEQSFLEDKFTGINGWILKNNKNKGEVSACGGKSMVGGYNIFGKGASAEKTFTIPSHTKLRLQMTVYKIDSWDNEVLSIKVDGTEVWKRSWNIQAGGANFCGSGVWFDAKESLDEIFNHSNEKALIYITSTLNQDANDESWGFRDFKLFYEAKEACAVFYSECDYKGASFEFCAKSPNFKNDNIPAQIRSIKIPPSGRVTLYESTDYNGKSVTYTEDQPCIKTYDFAFIQKRIEVQPGWQELQ